MVAGWGGWNSRGRSSDVVLSVWTSQGVRLDAMNKQVLDSHVLRFPADLISQQRGHQTLKTFSQEADEGTGSYLLQMPGQRDLMTAVFYQHQAQIKVRGQYFSQNLGGLSRECRMEILRHRIWIFSNSTKECQITLQITAPLYTLTQEI